MDSELKRRFRSDRVIDWSGISGDSALGRVLRYPLRWLPGGTLVTVRQGLNQGYRWISGSSVHGCWLGSYELEKQRILGRFAKPGMTAFDLGANAGFFTLAFSRLVGATGKVLAFEPLPDNVSVLRRHVELNGLQNVTVVEAAVCDKAGLASFERAASNAMGRLTFSDSSSLQVSTVTLDQLIAERTCPEPDILKVDVEGAESAVLRGATQLLRSRRATWLISLHGAGERDRCTQQLEAAGYRLSTLQGLPWARAPENEEELVAVPA